MLKIINYLNIQWILKIYNKIIFKLKYQNKYKSDWFFLIFMIYNNAFKFEKFQIKLIIFYSMKLND